MVSDGWGWLGQRGEGGVGKNVDQQEEVIRGTMGMAFGGNDRKGSWG